MDNNSNNGLSCVMGCWLAALAAGILLAALLMVIGGFAFTPAAFFGLLAFVLLGALLSYAICGGSNAKHGAGVAAAGAAGAAAAATGASASKSTSSTGSAAASASGAAAAASVGGASTAASNATAAGFAGVKGDTTLSGEDELAGRKGEWKYDGGEAEKPKAAAKKPAAKKPAASKAASKPAKAAAKPAKKTAAKKEAKPVAKDGKPVLLKKARAGGPDDLKQIKGVGPKMEGMLHTMGVFHFDQVASWRKAEVQWVDDNLEGFKGRVSRDEWVKQAKVLAKGGVTEFSKKVDKGGVY